MSMHENPCNEPSAPKAPTPMAAGGPLLTINARSLFQGEREICLILDGVAYRLRITRRNKLILQK